MESLESIFELVESSENYKNYFDVNGNKDIYDKIKVD